MVEIRSKGKAHFVPGGIRELKPLLDQLEKEGKRAAGVGWDPVNKMVILQWFDGTYVSYTPDSARAFAQSMLLMADKAERGEAIPKP